METFSSLLAIRAGNSPVPGEFPARRPVTRSFDVFFDLRLINCWVNNRKAGELRLYRAHYDVTVIIKQSKPVCTFIASAQNCYNHIAKALELPKPCTQPSMHCMLNPMDRWRNDNVIIMSKQRHDVVLT